MTETTRPAARDALDQAWEKISLVERPLADQQIAAYERGDTLAEAHLAGKRAGLLKAMEVLAEAKRQETTR